MIETRIVADSISPSGRRITTCLWKYPRFIHSEVMTHRRFSRNASSSRAIPVSKMLKAVISECAGPLHWGVNGRGMQAHGELTGWRRWAAKTIWKMSSYSQVGFAWAMAKVGAHKQIANRLIEPFAHMTVLVTATEWGNFFNLRADKDAQPEFQELAYSALQDYVNSVPVQKQEGEWHLPLGDRDLPDDLSRTTILKIITARAARTSYENFDGDINIAKDCQLHDDLLASGHMSPFEHAAQCMKDGSCYANFIGWKPYRFDLPNEERREFNSARLLEGRPCHQIHV